MTIPLPAFITPHDIAGHRTSPSVRNDDATPNDQAVRRNSWPPAVRPRPQWAESRSGIVAGVSVDAQPASQAGTAMLPIRGTSVDEEPSTSLAVHLRTLQDWIDSSPANEREERLDVGEQFRQCWTASGMNALAISGRTTLTSLPPIPATTPPLASLEISRCSSLETVPDLSQCTRLAYLQISGCPALTTPPDLSSCTHLGYLNVWDCAALATPPDLSPCRELKVLYLDTCPSLATAPDLAHCTGLGSLNLSNCAGLAALPDLSACTQLTSLQMTNCRSLAMAPVLSQCTQLTALNMSGCSGLATPPDLSHCTRLRAVNLSSLWSLTSMPAFDHQPQLRTVNLRETPLTSLPDGLLALPRHCVVELDAVWLSPSVHSQLDNILRQPAATRPNIRITAAAAAAGNAPVITRLDREVAAWRNEAAAPEKAALDLAMWTALPLEDNAIHFATFLARIRETTDYCRASAADKTVMQQRVVSLLAQLQGDGTLREDCFNLATVAVDSCCDRVAVLLLDMEMLCLDRRTQTAIRAGDYDTRPQALIDLCKGQYRMEVLTRLALEKAARSDSREEIEDRLRYLVALSEPYQLPVRVATMRFANFSSITPEDITEARSRIDNAGLTGQAAEKNNQAYHAFLAASPLMRSLLARLCGPAMAAANANNDRLIEDAKTLIHQQHARLAESAAQGGRDLSSSEYQQESLRLMQQYRAVDTAIPAQSSRQVLLDFLAQHHLSATL